MKKQAHNRIEVDHIFGKTFGYLVPIEEVEPRIHLLDVLIDK